MNQFKNILCPYDFSEYAEEALNYAFRLADAHTRLTLLHIVQLPYAIDPNGFIFYDINTEEVKKLSEKEALKKVEAWKAQYPSLDIHLEVVANNNPAEVILKAQQEGDYDLIVMGSHGRKGFTRLLMGSVAESVFRDASCPVLIIKKKT